LASLFPSRFDQLTEGADAGTRPFAQVVLGQEINGVRVVTLNRPRQLNGISDRVVRSLPFPKSSLARELFGLKWFCSPWIAKNELRLFVRVGFSACRSIF
jgi:hypothetical protein